jgi:hypothetical protein
MTEFKSKTDSPPAKKGGGVMDTIIGIFVLLLLLVAAGAGGYYYGTQQRFAPVKYVAGDTKGAVEEVTQNSSLVKKHYWISSSGHDHVGYAVTVYLNGQLVDKFFTPGRQVEINKFMKPGENSIRFEATALPPSMVDHKGDSNYDFDLAIQSGAALADPNPTNLLNYKRTSAEDKNYDDTMTFVVTE